MKSVILVILLAVIVNSARAQVQVGDSCYSLHGFISNPDSILIDTCHSTMDHPIQWVKRGYEVYFDDSQVLPRVQADIDTALGWQAIDTGHPQIRAAFGRFDSTIAHVLFRKQSLHDTLNHPYLQLYLNFDRYVLTDSVDSAFAGISGMIYQLVYAVPPTGVVSSEDIVPLSVSSNPFENTVQLYGLPIAGDIVVTDGRGISRLVIKATGESRQTLDFSSVPPGLYFVRVGNRMLKLVHTR